MKTLHFLLALVVLIALQSCDKEQVLPSQAPEALASAATFNASPDPGVRVIPIGTYEDQVYMDVDENDPNDQEIPITDPLYQELAMVIGSPSDACGPLFLLEVGGLLQATKGLTKLPGNQYQDGAFAIITYRKADDLARDICGADQAIELLDIQQARINPTGSDHPFSEYPTTP